MRTILVTGGAGYIGSHMVLALVERGEHRLAHGVALARIGKRDLESAVGTGASDEHGMP